MKCSNVIILFFAVVLARISSAHKSIKLSLYSPVNVLKTSELERGGWNMVFRGTSGNGDSVYDAWTRGTKTTSTKPASMRRLYGHHYRNPIVDKWYDLGVKLVKFAFYNEDKEVAHVIFDGRHSNINSWFAWKNVLYSSYFDLKPGQTYNYFSVEGHADVERRFFINKLYAGCPGDIGWMAVMNAKSRAPCFIDKQPSYPQFIYSTLTKYDLWDRRMFGTADYMAIFINTRY